MKYVFFIIPCLTIMAGCATDTPAGGGLSPQAAKVLVSPSKPAKGCKYINQVTANQSYEKVWGASDAALVQSTMDDLRNRVSNMGANYVQIINYSYDTTKIEGCKMNDVVSIGACDRNYRPRGQETTIEMSVGYVLGNAYSCKNVELTQ